MKSSDAGGISEADLDALERDHPEGFSTQQVVELFAARGERLSEATFRKYVQLGLLPRSVRVGRKGKHQGSQGLYPATVVRQLDRIRRLMGEGLTIGEIRKDYLFLGDIDGAARQLSQLLTNIDEVIGSRAETEGVDEVASRALGEARELTEQLIAKLRAIEQRLAMRARMARAAV
ncbi:MAG: hypothetical protein OXU20_19640 [Myxococcales bacterium]|nr:hypothetical protein [Myxococcales bacterium]MDD9965858.1 hypothetical protein [Myxococcales bacterium]